MDINNFVIDRILRGVALHTGTGEVLYSVNQIENPTLTCAAEGTDAVDALGSPIMTFERSKTAEFSAENSLIDLGLLATQMGTTKKIATADNKVITPQFETVDVTKDMTEYTLKHEPIEDIDKIYVLNGDSTLGKKYTSGVSSTASTFVYDKTAHKITLPSGLKPDSQLFIMYEYESDKAVEIVNSATKFPQSCKFIMQVLGADVCDTSTLIFAYLIFPNCKLSSNVELTFTTEGKHPFSLKANQAYCDKEKKLFQIVVPESE